MSLTRVISCATAALLNLGAVPRSWLRPLKEFEIALLQCTMWLLGAVMLISLWSIRVSIVKESGTRISASFYSSSSFSIHHQTKEGTDRSQAQTEWSAGLGALLSRSRWRMDEKVETEISGSDSKHSGAKDAYFGLHVRSKTVASHTTWRAHKPRARMEKEPSSTDTRAQFLNGLDDPRVISTILILFVGISVQPPR